MSSDPPAKGPRRAVRIGKYEVLAHVASGGMGAVYRARDGETGREVALKVLAPELAAKPAMLERFRREARHAARLRHENIVTLYEFDQASGTYYLAMEFVEGIDLHEYSQRKGPLDPDEALGFILQACRALDHAHGQGIVHRDVKPSNFLVTRKDDRLVVKMTDMGLAREASAEEFRVTRAGTTVGTLDYMAPEQARDSGSADIRSDLYSLGATWYHLLAGQAPFPKGGLAERLYKIMNDEPTDVRRLNPRVSDATARVLRRLLAKKPSARYQTPAELLEDLTALGEGAEPAGRREVLATLARGDEDAPPRPRSGTVKKGRPPSGPGGRPPRTRSASDTAIDRPRTVETRTRHPARWYVLGGAAAALLAAGVILALVLHGRKGRPDGEEARTQPPPGPPPAVTPFTPPPFLGGGQDPTPSPGPELKTNPGPAAPARPRWPVLYKPSAPIDAAKLRQEMEAPWAGQKADGPVTAYVARVPAAAPASAYPSLADACAAAAKQPAETGRACVLEVRDNGPLFETPAALAGHNLIIRAAPGYRPLIVWDLQRTLELRRRGPREAAARPLVFLDVTGGSLTLQGVDVVLKWPESVHEGMTLLQVRGGDLTVTDCTFSLTGKLAGGVPLARLRGAPAEGRPGHRCRFTRCFARGASLVALDLDAPGAEVLFDGCLVAGGEPPLLQVRADDKRGATLRAARSTLIAGQTFLRVQPANASDHNPAVRWRGWDSLLSRSSQSAGGALLQIQGGAGTGGVKWDAVNCLYAGWQDLLAGARTVSAGDLAEWRRLWGRAEGDAVVRDPWPAAAFADPGEVSAGTYRTRDTPVGFASSTSAERPLGCHLDALPPGRDNWPVLAYEPFPVLAPEALSDDDPPKISDPGDGLYHGGEVNLDADGFDLGASLESLRKSRRLAKRVVLHLSGTGERTMSPVRLEGCTLVLYFVRPEGEGARPLVLKPAPGSDRSPAGALVEIDGGGLDVIGGEFRVPDFQAGAPAYLFKVKGGDLRLFRCRLETGQLPAESFRGLVSFAGSGSAAADLARGCSINESVLVTGRAAVRVEGIGARLLLRQTLVASDADALQLDPGPACRDRANVQCLLERTTVAAREDVVRLAGGQASDRVLDPVIVQSRDCAFLNPFTGKRKRSGLLLFDRDALARGLLLWQSDGDAYDRRLQYGAASGKAPDKPQKLAEWFRLWGSAGVRRPRELSLTRTLDGTRWPLEKLLLPQAGQGRGADLVLIGVIKKPKSPR